MTPPALNQFCPVIREWFAEEYGKPTEVQAAAWPQIFAGNHVVVTAPTGSGKTLTAFLCGINALITGQWDPKELSLLYVSPLKALNNDIERNLVYPLKRLKETAARTVRKMPEIRVATRSGDTPSSERQSMVRTPPAILITTPESLNLILSSPRAREMLRTVRSLIIDEVHAVIGGKRGTHLMTAVERVARLAGEFQRIALSATVRPISVVCEFVGGYTPDGPRPVRPIAVRDSKKIDLKVDFPEVSETESEPGYWPHLRRHLLQIVEANRSTLIFVNTRRHAEKITLLLNEDRPQPIAYSHHGSLARELRQFVERSLKAGDLKAIVATNSLELGIDIGTLDQVVLVGTPGEIRSTIQRVGRAGHTVGAISRAVLFPLHGRDLVDAVVMKQAVDEREIESVKPVVAPLDVLAQLIISMTIVSDWDVDELFDAIRLSWPYHTLKRQHFDLTLEMLAGRYGETRLAELRPRLILDRVKNKVRARDGARLLLYSSGGTIPDRGYFQLRLQGGGRIGELDEEFVWERRVGQSFVLGSQMWTIQDITDKDVIVSPAKPGSSLIPFWRALSQGRHPFYAGRVLDFLKSAANAMAAGNFENYIAGLPLANDRSRRALAEVLTRQTAHTGVPLPHQNHVVIEQIAADPRPGASEQARTIAIHTLRGLSINAPIALALEAHLRTSGFPEIEIHAGNDSLVMQLSADERPEELFSPSIASKLGARGELTQLLRATLESSAIFGALFRENAGRALLLPRGGFGKRMPLWLNRMRSKRIIQAVAQLPDFPITLETWRTCLNDLFDLPAAREFLSGISTGEIALSFCATSSPSPFAKDIVWQQTNVAMYKDDAAGRAGVSATNDDLLRSVIYDKELRPQISEHTVEAVRARLDQTAVGYTPGTTDELIDWFDEHIVVPAPRLEALADAVTRDHGDAVWLDGPPRHLLCWIRTADKWLLASRNRVPVWASVYSATASSCCFPVQKGPEWPTPPSETEAPLAWPTPAAQAPAVSHAAGSGDSNELAEALSVLCQERLRLMPPVDAREFAREHAIPIEAFTEILHQLIAEEAVIEGTLITGQKENLICHADVFEYLLRFERNQRRPTVQPVRGEELVPFWARRTGIISDRPNRANDLVGILDTLFGYPAGVGLWETAVFPARMPDYSPLWLDGLLAENELIWYGAGKEQVSFALESEFPLFHGTDQLPEESEPTNVVTEELRKNGPADLFSLQQRLGTESEETTKLVWEAVWAGQVSNTRFSAVRDGVRNRFSSANPRSGAPTGSRWPGRRPRSSVRPNIFSTRGEWFALPGVAPDRNEERLNDQESMQDPVTLLEDDKDRCRILLARYGLLCRDLCTRENTPVRWSRLFSALRVMELSGELVSGVFAHDLSTPQFAERSTLEEMAAHAASSDVYWMNATDPASPCGVLGTCFDGRLPNRIGSSFLVFRGTSLIAVISRNGKEMEIFVEPHHEDAAHALLPLKAMVSRNVSPATRVAVEVVNRTPVRESPYRDMLKRNGFTDNFKAFVLSASYR